jgi:hypothetical protein
MIACRSLTMPLVMPLMAAGLCCALSLSGCSLLVDPQALVIKCEVTPGSESKDPCTPAGMHCVASECKTCRNVMEICNGIDDDCDGIVDEGQDEDGDGFTWCGGGDQSLADCAVSDPKIHPASKPGPDGKIAIPAPQELCDGKDNDCDGKVDEAPECAAKNSCTPNSCPGVQVCDTTTGVCIEPRPVGSGCSADSDCAGGFCVHPNDYGLSVALKDNRCASACCSDADCTMGSVCVISNAGARLCLPANIAGQADGQPGDRCMRDLDCASGACDRGRCAMHCFTDSDCTTGVCTLSPGSLSEPRLWLCGDAQGRDPGGALCSQFDPTACRSGACNDENACAEPCGRSSDCDTDELCDYTTVRPALLFTEASTVTGCESKTGGAASLTDVLCCTSMDCGASQLCAPKVADTNLWVMTCR